jgi:hypothetical protein
MYFFKPRGISFSVMLRRYSSATAGMSLFAEKAASFSGSTAHLFDRKYARSSAAIVGSLSNVKTFTCRPFIDFGNSQVFIQ